MLINNTEPIDGDITRGLLAHILPIRFEQLADGVYNIGQWLSYPLIDGWSDIDYGVADNVEQILDYHKDLLDDPSREFIVTVVVIEKKDQPERGGWRWHKWGKYIGNQNPKHEYIYDEDGIESVMCYNIIEKKGE